MDESGEARPFDLRRHARLLWRRKAILIASTVLLLGVALTVSLLQEPLYEGRVKVLVGRSKALSLAGQANADQADPGRVIQNEIQLIESERIANAVPPEMRRGTKVSATASSDSDVIVIHSRAGTAAHAADSARAYAEAYVEYRRTKALEDITVASDAVRAQLDELQDQIDVLNRQIASAVSTSPGSSNVVSGLIYQRDQLLSQQSPLRDRLSQLQVNGGIQPSDDQILTIGRIPVSKLRPHPVTTGIAGGVLGLLVGIGVVVLLESLDDLIRTREDVERVVTNVPVLGVLPVIPGWRKPGEPYLVTLDDPASGFAEAFRTLRTSLQFVGSRRAPRVWQVVSPNPEEGKTSAVCNLAVVMAQAGQRVALVDCDLRRPRAPQFFGLQNQPGFTSVFLGETTLASAFQTVPGLPTLSVLASGPLPSNPADILSSTKTSGILTDLRRQFDVVLVDCPPVLPVTDPIVLSTWVDATVLLANAETTRRGDLREAVERLRQADATVVGIVLNRVKLERTYEYRYGYTSEDQSGGRSARSAAAAAQQRDSEGGKGQTTTSRRTRLGAGGHSDVVDLEDTAP
jgi:capsular exopolysaccharide synthesis family protein